MTVSKQLYPVKQCSVPAAHWNFMHIISQPQISSHILFNKKVSELKKWLCAVIGQLLSSNGPMAPRAVESFQQQLHSPWKQGLLRLYVTSQPKTLIHTAEPVSCVCPVSSADISQLQKPILLPSFCLAGDIKVQCWLHLLHICFVLELVKKKKKNNTKTTVWKCSCAPIQHDVTMFGKPV